MQLVVPSRRPALFVVTSRANSAISESTIACPLIEFTEPKEDPASSISSRFRLVELAIEGMDEVCGSCY